MNFVQELQFELAPYHLLKHPFYQKWEKGDVSKNQLKYYAGQYYHHVSAFPRYISALHSLCEDAQGRKILLENLNDEEGQRGSPHPELWMKFAEGLGLTKEEVKEVPLCVEIKSVIDTFFTHCRSSYPQGLSALYSYEYQVPEIAETKMKGLKKHYKITDKKTLSFFEEHKSADVYHRQAIEVLLEKFSSSDKEKAKKSAVSMAESLWNFLTHVEKEPV